MSVEYVCETVAFKSTSLIIFLKFSDNLGWHQSLRFYFINVCYDSMLLRIYSYTDNCLNMHNVLYTLYFLTQGPTSAMSSSRNYVKHLVFWGFFSNTCTAKCR